MTFRRVARSFRFLVFNVMLNVFVQNNGIAHHDGIFNKVVQFSDVPGEGVILQLFKSIDRKLLLGLIGLVVSE